MRFLHAFAFLFKGAYDLLASYLLAWVIFFAVAAFGFFTLADYLAVYYEFGTQELMWQWVSQLTDVSPRWSRFWLYLIAHGLALYLFRKVIRFAQRQLEKIFDFFIRTIERATYGAPIQQALFQLLFTATITAMLVPFVIQPTMVPLDNRLDSWGWRMTNLVDGSASDAIVESGIGLYRKIYSTPQVQAEVATVADFDQAAEVAEIEDAPSTLQTGPTTDGPATDGPATDGPATDGPATDGHTPDGPGTTPTPPRVRAPPRPVGKQPLMDRWDPLLEKATGGDADLFAKTKAFMWVESAGRQFAVSSTGCAGLMQFCVGTARSEPFRSIYGVGQVYACGCGSTRCRIPKPIQRALETGGQEAVEAHRDAFPCDLSDARFNAEKAITAGAAYIKRLSKQHGGNIYLMYIGYNSGPGISKKVYRRLGKKPDASLDEIGLHLAEVLGEYYGDKAPRRARSLLEVHLPKIRRAEARFAKSGGR